MTLPDLTSIAPFGIGCAYILPTAHDRRLLETAYHEGARHFDVAPSYGAGFAETVLGDTLKKHRHQITITTKFGLPRPAQTIANRFKAISKRKIRNHFPMRPRNLNTHPAASNYSAFNLDACLRKSLIQLKTDYIDIYLLHMVRADQMTDELVRALEYARQAGTVRRIGLATTANDAAEILARYPKAFDVVQVEWNAFQAPLPAMLSNSNITITHRPLRDARRQLLQLLDHHPAAIRTLEGMTGYTFPRDINAALIHAAMAPSGADNVLFASRHIGHTVANIHAAQDPRAQEKGALFLAALQEVTCPSPA